MSRYAYNVPGEPQTFVVPDRVQFITIAAAGAGRGTVVESPVIPVSPGDTVEITLGGRATPGSGTGGINGGGAGHGGSGALGPSGGPISGNPLGTWTTAGHGCTEVRLNGTLILVAGGHGGPSLAFFQGSGDPRPSVLAGYVSGTWGQPMLQGGGFPTEYVDAEGLDDPLVVETMPSSSEPNRVAQDTTAVSGLSLHTAGSPGGTATGGSGDVADREIDETYGYNEDGTPRPEPYEWTYLYTAYAGGGGGGYGGGASGSIFVDGSGSKYARSGKLGTSYAAYPHRADPGTSSPSSPHGIIWVSSPQLEGTCLVTFPDAPVAVLAGPDEWDGVTINDGGVWTIPGWINFTIYGSYLDRVDALGEQDSYILLSPEDYASWTGAGSPFPSAEWGSRRPRNPLTQAGSIAASIEWDVIDLSSGDTVYTQTSGLNFNAWKLRWLPDYISENDGDAPSGRFRVRMRLRGLGLANPLGSPGLGSWSEWVEHDIIITGGDWVVGAAAL